MEYGVTYSFKVTCRVAIQVCVGRLPSGRESHRTFSMKGIRPDASVTSIAEVIRALAPLLAYPITKVRKIVTAVKTMTFHKKEAPVRLMPQLTAFLVLLVLLCGGVRKTYPLPAAVLSARRAALYALATQCTGGARSPPFLLSALTCFSHAILSTSELLRAEGQNSQLPFQRKIHP